MKKLYAIFKKEEDAQKAISKIVSKEKSAKAELIFSDHASIDRDLFKFDAYIIGSPFPMASQFDISGYENLNISPTHAGLSAFCYADFVATAKNSLASSAKDNFPISNDVYKIGVALKIPSSMEKYGAKILTRSGGRLIN